MRYISLTLHDKSVWIEIEKELIPIIKKSLFSDISEIQSKCAFPDYFVKMQDPVFQIYKEGILGGQFSTPEELIYNLEWIIMDDLVKANSQYMQLHGCSMVYDDECYIFLGHGQSGKTSLSILLMEQAFRFLTDEMVLVVPNSHMVLPFPRNLIIKDYSWPLLSLDSEWPIIHLEKDEKYYQSAKFIPPSCFGSVIKNGRFPIRKIFFLNPSGKVTITPVNSADASHQLLQYWFNSHLFNIKILDILQSLTASIDFYELSLTDPLSFSGDEKQNLKHLILE